MPRNRSQQAEIKPTAVVASGIQLAGPNRQKAPKPINPEAWQQAAWTFFDVIGEYRYSVSWVGNLLSRVELTVRRNGEITDDPRAQEALRLLFGGPDGQREMMRQLGIHFTVAGDAYVVAEGRGESIGDQWYVVAAVEMKWTGTEWKIGKEALSNPLVVRTHKPHPRRHKDSDSPTRAVLPILAEIDGLTKHVSAQIDSRLAGAGLLILPSEISFAAASQADPTGAVQNNPDASAQQFLATLGENMIRPIENRDSASAIVPVILQAAGEHLDKIQHLKFWSDLDQHAIELRTEAIRRLALGMDMPPEILTGTAEMNHWGAWQMEESQIKAHTEPLIAIITQSLTEGYLRPFLIGDGMSQEEAFEFDFGADTTALRLRPNRSKEAAELFQMGELRAETLRRENGFTEEDAPDEEERRLFNLRRVASGSTTPELVEAALRELGIPLEVVQAEVIEEGTEARPQPSLTEHPTRDIPDTQEDGLAASAAQNLAGALIASQVYVLRALERAGNRMKTRHGQLPEGVVAADAYMFYPQVDRLDAAKMIEDAWTYVDRVDCGLPPAFLARELHTFTATLIAERKRFDFGDLRDHMLHAARTEGLCP